MGFHFRTLPSVGPGMEGTYRLCFLQVLLLHSHQMEGTTSCFLPVTSGSFYLQRFLLSQEKFIILDGILPLHSWRQFCRHCTPPVSPRALWVCRGGVTGHCGWWGGASVAASSRPLKESIPLDASCIPSSFLTSLDTS